MKHQSLNVARHPGADAHSFSARKFTGSQSLWLDEIYGNGTPARHPLFGADKADVCVVGAGFTGLWTAIDLKRRDPAVEVVVLEADRCGSGPSGQSAGVVGTYMPKLSTLVQRLGTERALWLARESAAVRGWLGTFCAEHGIDADFTQHGWLWTASSKAQLRAWDETVKYAASLGEEPFLELDTEEIQARTGSPIHLAGIIDPQGARVQPAALVDGMARVAEGLGVRIYEHSEVRGIDTDRGRVTTAQGAVDADTVVLATGAFSRVPALRRGFVTTTSDLVATAPIPEELDASGYRECIAIDNSRLSMTGIVRTTGGRVVFGSAGAALGYQSRPTAPFNRAEFDRMMKALPAFVPGAAGAPITHAWSGMIDKSVDGLPSFGQLPGRTKVLYAVGFSGNGVGPCVLAGRMLGAMALGVDDEWAECGRLMKGTSVYPPEPFRSIGGSVVRAAVIRSENRKDLGLKVGTPTRIAASLAATSSWLPAGE
ncbi:NAD(P)/FAD-dependent oxidoreductase [Dietzia lutea]|nr:FAD-binding oxidoreductase [Dietzia lutea]